MTYEKYDYPRDFLEQTRRGVAEVTPQDVYRVSQEYLAPDAMDVLVLGNPEGFGEPLSALTQGGGEVNEIDISIPTSPPSEAEEQVASEEDQAAGQDLLAEVREAMGGNAYDQIENMRQSLETQAGQRTIAQTIATDLSGRIHAEVEAPQGMVTIINTGEQTYMQMGGRTQPAPAQLRRQFLSGLQQDPTYLMTRAGELEAADQGTQTVEGTEYRALRITLPEGDAFTMLVNPDTMMPARLITQAQGQEATTVLGDFRQESGVMVPYERAVYQGGQQRATTTVTGFETNVDFPDGYFSVDQ
jgi:outer membrane lipoprotein-sorting protein